MASLIDMMSAAVVAAGWLLLTIAAAGVLYTVAATVVFRRFFDGSRPSPARSEAVSLMKPLCGPEPALAANLGTFLAQDHHGPLQLVCGVAGHDDLALHAVERLCEGWPGSDIAAVVDATRHGASAKVSNLANMLSHAAHSTLVLSDSDMVAQPTYLARVLEALEPADVGAVSVLYRGRADAGFWSTLGAAGLSYQFLPGAVFGVALGLADPCMGSTIALHRSTIARIGGFARFADILADDYAIGAAVRGLGLKVAVPRFVMTHASAETSLVQLWRHEVRWGATVRGLVPASYVGSLVSMPVPLAALGLALAQAPTIGACVLATALVSRFVLARAVDAEVGERSAPPWLLPLRDFLSLAVFATSLFARTVDWRGTRHRITAGHTISPDTESIA